MIKKKPVLQIFCLLIAVFFLIPTIVQAQMFESSAMAPVSPEEKKPFSDFDKIESLLEGGSTENDQQYYTDLALLQGLNKITARISDLQTPIAEQIEFGKLVIKVHACWKSPPEDLPENKALVEIWEYKLDEPESLIFFGWMFSSTPGISALEHPVYDVTLVECKAQVAAVETPVVQ